MPIVPPAKLARARQRKTEPQSVAAPLKGWNTRDPYEAMDPLDAIVLDNWYPDFAGLTCRNGSQPYVSGMGSAPVKTLANFVAGSTSKFLAGCSGRIFDITNEGTATSLSGGFTSDAWQTCLFNAHLILANGKDPVQIYDGTDIGPSGFTGVPTNTLLGVGSFNNRLYFWTGKDAGFWYGPTLGISGALTYFPVSMVTSAGGNVIDIDVLSYDGGQGIDDYTCIFMSSGEVLMYQGTDPSNPNNWALVGRYLLAIPVGPRAITRYGGDLYLTTSSDHQQLSKLFIALRLGETPPRTKASGAVISAYELGADLFGWQALYYPAGTRMIYNIPSPDGTFSQHIFNTSTQAWCRFRGMNAYTFGLFNGNLFFGTANGTVLQADVGTSDSGTAITCQAQQAWQLFDTPLKKRVAAVRPEVQSQGEAAFAVGLGYDYQPPQNNNIPDSTIIIGGTLVWGFGNWGAPSVWGGSGVTDSRWHLAGGEGGAIGLALSANSLLGVIWIRTDFMLEPGSAL